MLAVFQDGALLAETRYAPNPHHLYNIGNHLAVVDAANLKVSFTVPESGSVMITKEAACWVQSLPGGYTIMDWCLFSDSAGQNQVGPMRRVLQSPMGQDLLHRCENVNFLDGLTPGEYMTLYWGAGCWSQSALPSYCQFLVGDGSGTIVNGQLVGDDWGAAIIQVFGR